MTSVAVAIFISMKGGAIRVFTPLNKLPEILLRLTPSKCILGKDATSCDVAVSTCEVCLIPDVVGTTIEESLPVTANHVAPYDPRNIKPPIFFKPWPTQAHK